jgi:tetratricopeptide (TPR) repeat protein
MIRHQVYFDALGSMQEGTPSWRSVFAGLSVLRLVDASNESSSPANRANWALVHTVRTAIDEMSSGDLIRGVLTGVVDAFSKTNGVDDVVCEALISYGRALDYEASWGLATDVFLTVASLVKRERNPRLAVDAHIAAGGAARRNGEWEISARAYSQAAFLADTLGDRPGVLTVQVGIANTYLAKGNLPQAQSILDDVIVQANDLQLRDIQAVALHSRAAVAARRGEHTEGLRLAYEALELTSNATQKDFVLADIGGMFAELGMHESARDANLVLASTSQTKFVQWTATLNLMELASLDGMDVAFDGYARELAKTPLGVWHRSHYLLFLGEGFARLGREEAATEALEQASYYAATNQIHQIAFKAQTALTTVRSTPRPQTVCSSSPAWVPEDLNTVVRAISDLRKAALATA